MLDKDLLKLVTSKKKLIVFNVVNQVVALAMNLIITFSIIFLIKACIEYNGNNWQYIVIYTVTAIVSASIRFINYFIGTKLTNEVGDYASVKLRADAFVRYFKLQNKYTYKSNEISQLLTEGVEQLKLYYAVFIPAFFFSMIAPLILFIVMSPINWKVSLIYLAGVPLIPISIIAISKFAKKIFNKYWHMYLNLGNNFADNVNGLKELKIFNSEQKALSKISSDAEKFRKITMKVLVMQLASVTIMDLVAFGGASIGIVVSLISYFDGDINLYWTIFMILVGAEFFLPMRALGSAFHMAMNGATAGKKILSILKENIVKSGIIDIDTIHNVNVNDVKLIYNGKFILNDIKLNFKKGNLYCIVGASGSGKTNMVKIVAHLNDQYRGKVFVDSNKLNDIKKTSYYQKICYIDNNSLIFNDTIRNNFKFYNEKITDNEIIDILKKFNLQQLIDNKKGLDTIINENSTNLSGGQKQRLILACNLTKKYELYIFDEITSNIDNESEALFIKHIKSLSKNSIVIFITHRMKNILDANYVYHLEKGKVIEANTPNNLLKNKKSKTFKLFNEQKRLEILYEKYVNF